MPLITPPPNVYDVILAAGFVLAVIAIIACMVTAAADPPYFWRTYGIVMLVLTIITIAVAVVIYQKQWHDFRLDCLDSRTASVYCSSR